MSTFMFKYLNHDERLLKFNKPLHFFAEMPHNQTGHVRHVTWGLVVVFAGYLQLASHK